MGISVPVQLSKACNDAGHFGHSNVSSSSSSSSMFWLAIGLLPLQPTENARVVHVKDAGIYVI